MKSAFDRLLITCLLSILFVSVETSAQSDTTIEDRLIQNLDSGDPAIRDAAAVRPGELESERAIPKLVELFFSNTGSPPYFSASGEALLRIGAPAATAVLERVELKRRLYPQVQTGCGDPLAQPARGRSRASVRARRCRIGNASQDSARSDRLLREWRTER